MGINSTAKRRIEAGWAKELLQPHPNLNLNP
jgi:hypothetical protein